MKIDRLLGILTLLLDKETVTAPELAEYFEVSRRTINRDIEDLNLAGFPIVTRQGSGGGISILNRFKLNKKLLKEDDLTNIIAGLKGLESITKNPQIELLLKQINPEKEQSKLIDENISIDLASFYKESLSEKIDILNQAIKKQHSVNFNYYNKSGKELRKVDPQKIIYKWSDWYLSGYCRNRSDFRMFKLNRLWNLIALSEKIQIRPTPDPEKNYDTHLTDVNKIEILFNKKSEYKLIETYGPHCYIETDNSLLHYKGNYTNKDFIISWILSFGDMAEVIKPVSIREEINNIALNIVKKYS